MCERTICWSKAKINAFKFFFTLQLYSQSILNNSPITALVVMEFPDGKICGLSTKQTFLTGFSTSSSWVSEATTALTIALLDTALGWGGGGRFGANFEFDSIRAFASFSFSSFALVLLLLALLLEVKKKIKKIGEYSIHY